MSSIYGTLGYVDTSLVTNFSANTIEHLNYSPPLLDPWQVQDIANNNTSGYFQNPVANVTKGIWNTSNTLYTATNGLKANIILYPTDYAAINLAIANTRTILYKLSTNTANSYLYLTNRLSNVVDIGTDNSIPHYSSAIRIGKLMMYLTSQSDSIQNNSPIIGNFTSIMIGNTLNSLNTSFSNSATILLNSISGSNSNINLSQARTLENIANSVNNTMVKYYNDNLAFYYNSINVWNGFSSTNGLSASKLGETEKMLINNFIGTIKLTSRINS